jgi:hypothetical protein
MGTSQRDFTVHFVTRNRSVWMLLLLTSVSYERVLLHVFVCLFVDFDGYVIVEQSSIAKPTRSSPSNVMKRSPQSAKGQSVGCYARMPDSVIFLQSSTEIINVFICLFARTEKNTK